MAVAVVVAVEMVVIVVMLGAVEVGGEVRAKLNRCCFHIGIHYPRASCVFSRYTCEFSYLFFHINNTLFYSWILRILRTTLLTLTNHRHV